MQLRDLIKDKHDEAERHPFVKALFNGSLPQKAYAEFLYNQLPIYRIIENTAEEFGLLSGIEGIKRVEKIQLDLEFHKEPGLKLHDSTYEYIDYVSKLSSERVLAHVYVRHMGDMFGGSMIKKVISGPGNMYEFENRSELIQNLRGMLHSGLAEEAKVVFGFAIKLFDEIANEHNIR